MISGKSVQGGVAYVNVLCSPANGYGVSQVRGSFNLSKSVLGLGRGRRHARARPQLRLAPLALLLAAGRPLLQSGIGLLQRRGRRVARDDHELLPSPERRALEHRSPVRSDGQHADRHAGRGGVVSRDRSGRQHDDDVELDDDVDEHNDATDDHEYDDDSTHDDQHLVVDDEAADDEHVDVDEQHATADDDAPPTTSTTTTRPTTTSTSSSTTKPPTTSTSTSTSSTLRPTTTRPPTTTSTSKLIATTSTRPPTTTSTTKSPVTTTSTTTLPGDGDADGVVNGVDACPNTPAGDVVDPRGCTLCACAAASHDAYVSCVRDTVDASALAATSAGRRNAVRQAKRSTCGRGDTTRLLRLPERERVQGTMPHAHA
jgi:hypothetical protein